MSDDPYQVLGLPTDSPRTVHVIEDLMTAGHGLDIAERIVTAEEVGQPLQGMGVPVLAVVREGWLLHYNEPEAAVLQQIKELELLATRWSVAVGGQGARAIEDRLRDTKIELLDDLTALHNRLTILLSICTFAPRS